MGTSSSINACASVALKTTAPSHLSPQTANSTSCPTDCRAPDMGRSGRRKPSCFQRRYVVKCKAQFKRRSTANNVETVPGDADSPKFRVRQASCQQLETDPDRHRRATYTTRPTSGVYMSLCSSRPLAHAQLDVEPPARPPLTVKFEIPYLTVSGIQVRCLKIVEKSGYQVLPGVRYTEWR